MNNSEGSVLGSTIKDYLGCSDPRAQEIEKNLCNIYKRYSDPDEEGERRKRVLDTWERSLNEFGRPKPTTQQENHLFNEVRFAVEDAKTKYLKKLRYFSFVAFGGGYLGYHFFPGHRSTITRVMGVLYIGLYLLEPKFCQDQLIPDALSAIGGITALRTAIGTSPLKF